MPSRENSDDSGNTQQRQNDSAASLPRIFSRDSHDSGITQQRGNNSDNSSAAATSFSRPSSSSGRDSHDRNNSATSLPKPHRFTNDNRRRSGGGIPRSPPGNHQQHKAKDRDVDTAMDYFSNKDPAETKLLDVLEEQATSLSHSSARQRLRIPGRAAKMHQVMKQMSSRRLVTAGHHGSRDDEDNGRPIERTRSSQSSDSKLYDSLANIEDLNRNLGSTPNSQRHSGNRMRSSSHASSIDGSRQSSSRRIPAQTRDLHGPTSAFLSNLRDNFDDPEENAPAEESPSMERRKRLARKAKEGRHRRLKTSTDALFDHAQNLENLFGGEQQNHFDDLPAEVFRGQQQQGGQIGSPNVSSVSSDEGNNEGRDEEGGVGVRRPLLPRRQTQQRKRNPCKRAYAFLANIWGILGPEEIWDGLCEFLLHTVLLIMVPLLSISAILFYGFKNPDFNFLPTEATMSWWLIFAARLMTTFSLARASQYLMEVFTTRTTLIVRLAGPFVALVAMQSLGWPFLLASFGSWTMLLMRGVHPFVKNWLCFLHIAMFSKENGDGRVLESSLFGRFLAAMIFVGVATAAKRTAVALYLSRRMLQYYRRHLRDLLADMKLIMEVSELASETQTEEFAKLMYELDENNNASIRSNGGFSNPSNKASLGGDIALTTLKASALKVAEKLPLFSSKVASADILTKTSSGEEDDDDIDDHDDDDDDLIISDDEDEFPAQIGYSGTPLSRKSVKTDQSGKTSYQSRLASVDGTEASSRGPVQWSKLKSQVMPKHTGAGVDDRRPVAMMSTDENERKDRLKSSSHRGLDKLLQRLDRWEEPETKGAKKALPSLHDILQFRKAMDFMGSSYPFSAAFGLARNRRECIRSAVRVYRRLLKFTPGDSVLHFDVIGALAYDEDGDLDEKRVQSLLQVFLPEKDDWLPQLSFVQSVDYVYKNLRFLRASILNSSKIDSVLEDVFDVIFNFILGIVVMTMLGLNPWPLLVSFSTVMVSFAFSFGPSCAKYIEGTLMIAVRRPYDIGDRITIIAGESLTQPTSSDTWLVEDITLSTTTLRYAATNEISTVNNAAIANSRIVNGARSVKAIVTISINFNVVSTHEQIETFRIRIENYLFDRPETWAGLVHFRNDAICNNDGFVTYLLRVQHQRSWQDMPPVMVSKGELQRYANKVAVDLGIVWQSPHHRLRIMELPVIRKEDEEIKDDTKEIEPFMKFLKEETGL